MALPQDWEPIIKHRIDAIHPKLMAFLISFAYHAEEVAALGDEDFSMVMNSYFLARGVSIICSEVDGSTSNSLKAIFQPSGVFCSTNCSRNRNNDAKEEINWDVICCLLVSVARGTTINGKRKMQPDETPSADLSFKKPRPSDRDTLRALASIDGSLRKKGIKPCKSRFSGSRVSELRAVFESSPYSPPTYNSPGPSSTNSSALSSPASSSSKRQWISEEVRSSTPVELIRNSEPSSSIEQSYSLSSANIPVVEVQAIDQMLYYPQSLELQVEEEEVVFNLNYNPNPTEQRANTLKDLVTDTEIHDQGSVIDVDQASTEVYEVIINNTVDRIASKTRNDNDSNELIAVDLGENHMNLDSFGEDQAYIRPEEGEQDLFEIDNEVEMENGHGSEDEEENHSRDGDGDGHGQDVENENEDEDEDASGDEDEDMNEEEIGDMGSDHEDDEVEPTDEDEPPSASEVRRGGVRTKGAFMSEEERKRNNADAAKRYRARRKAIREAAKKSNVDEDDDISKQSLIEALATQSEALQRVLNQVLPLMQSLPDQSLQQSEASSSSSSFTGTWTSSGHYKALASIAQIANQALSPEDCDPRIDLALASFARKNRENHDDEEGEEV
ncbi:uncharacterized protein IL334_007970 [Kwoniella shivajii]|uniref:BZIP domain-containing protein n=1 Tax=Kwoniella shivajii TaxID=564305 RepID=A0ABZ1DD90_9TREE|nr:hypothetical protein IL334_007970 [Kwoniella shivajii]